MEQQPTPPPLPTPQTFYHQAAIYSLLAPIAAVGLTFFGHNLVVSLIGTSLILSGLVLGIVALFGIKKHGARKILWRALAGIIISGFLILSAALAISKIIKIAERAREQQRQQSELSR